MKRPISRLALLLAVVALGAFPGGAFAQGGQTPPPVNLSYRGGALLANVQVVTLFWGPDWSGSQLPDYFNSFLRALFADGRYMANLGEYSVSGFPIGNGTLGATAMDIRQPRAMLHDATIQTEIRSQIAQGHLPPPDDNTVYAVFAPPGVEVFGPDGGNSRSDFLAYHFWSPGKGGFPYIVMPYEAARGGAQNSMTLSLSHELAEVVTDPDPDDRPTEHGWFDDSYGEVADIVNVLHNDGLIDDSDFMAQLNAADGSTYAVEKFWSMKQNAPVAF